MRTNGTGTVQKEAMSLQEGDQLTITWEHVRYDPQLRQILRPVALPQVVRVASRPRRVRDEPSDVEVLLGPGSWRAGPGCRRRAAGHR